MARMKRRTRAAPRREAMGGLAKGLEVIRAFTRESPSLTLSEIASHARLPAATARRCLLTLAELGYVMQSGRNFLLRPKVLELGAAYLESMNIETLTKTYLEDLARQTGDSAALTVLDGTEIVYVARASVRTLMRLEAHVGSRFPAYPTSMGACCSPASAPSACTKYFATRDLRRAHRAHRDGSARSCMKLIEECRRVGYAAVEDELAYGVVAVAVPVFDQARRVVAALNSSSHSKKITQDEAGARARRACCRSSARRSRASCCECPGLSLSAQT